MPRAYATSTQSILSIPPVASFSSSVKRPRAPALVATLPNVRCPNDIRVTYLRDPLLIMTQAEVPGMSTPDLRGDLMALPRVRPHRNSRMVAMRTAWPVKLVPPINDHSFLSISCTDPHGLRQERSNASATVWRE